MEIKGYAALEAGGALKSFSYESKTLADHDVEIKITHCGICHSDIHLIDDDWKASQFPFIPGHEIAGKVEKIGRHVNHLRVGDRVGVGWQRSACLECEDCLRGEENVCEKSEATCIGHHGGYASHIQVDSRFAFRLPEGLDSENAAPLLCGGITVFSPLVHYGVTPTMKVGVVGIGGLGHMALQFAKAFGCEVTAFSSSPNKEEEARSFGADRFISSVDSKAMQEASRSLDFIMSTVTVGLDWQQYLSILRPNGKLCFVGASPDEICIYAGNLISGRKTICGSPIGSRTDINKMLEFSARHHIVAKTELMPLDKVNEALQKVRENKARYRMVLKVGD